MNLNLIIEALEAGLDLAVANQADIAVRYKGYKPDKHAAAAADVILIEDALKEAKEALGDTERLDWMEKHLLREASMRLPDHTFKAVNAWSIASAGTNLREAIDAAKNAPQETCQHIPMKDRGGPNDDEVIRCQKCGKYLDKDGK